MLAQSFMSAEDLGISELMRQSLVKVLVMFETEKFEHAKYDIGTEHGFNMATWSGEGWCGTVKCIGGWAEHIGNFSIDSIPRSLDRLFYPQVDSFRLEDITTEQAAIALRLYLTVGDAKWDLALQ